MFCRIFIIESIGGKYRMLRLFIERNADSFMTYDGDFKGEEWNNGRLITGLGNSYGVVNGILDFVKDSNDEFGTKVRENNWVEKNWAAEKRRYENMEYCRDIAKIVIDIGGNILEVGA